MKANKLALSVLAGALACSALVTAQPAYADPTSGTFRPLAGTGSDTTQSVLNGLADVITDGGAKVIASYDAINPANGQAGGKIQTRAGGPSFDRPNGSGAGIQALTSAVKGLTYPASNGVDVTAQLDFARSSSGPSGSGTDLTYIPFAKDAVSYAYSNTDAATAVPSNLTKAQLKDIFSGVTTSYTGADSASHTYKPILPQSGSGSRKFFLSALGLTETNVAWITTTFQENEGTTIDAVGEIAPFSAAAYIAQVNGKITNTISAHTVKLGSIDSVAPILGNGTLNSSFGLARDVYNVVATSRLTGTSAADRLLQATFVGGTSKVCAATSTITDYGFGAIATCGATTTTGPFTVNGSVPSLSATAAPVLSGAAKVGGMLSATPGAWAASTTPSYTYQWLRGGAVIAGASANVYKVAVADAGTALSVRVTATALSASGSATSAAVNVAKQSSGIKVSFDKAAKKKNKAGKATVVVSVVGIVPTGSVVISEKSKKLGSATLVVSKKGKVTIKIKKLKKGKHVITVVYAGTSAINGSTAKVTLKVK